MPFGLLRLATKKKEEITTDLGQHSFGRVRALSVVFATPFLEENMQTAASLFISAKFASQSFAINLRPRLI